MTDTPIFDRLLQETYEQYSTSTYGHFFLRVKNEGIAQMLDWLDILRYKQKFLTVEEARNYARGGVVITANKIELSHGEHVMNRTTSSSYGENIILRFL